MQGLSTGAEIAGGPVQGGVLAHDLGGSGAEFSEGGMEDVFEMAVFVDIMVRAMDVITVAVGAGVEAGRSLGGARAEGDVFGGGFRVTEESAELEAEFLILRGVGAKAESLPGTQSVAELLGGVSSFADENVVKGAI